MLLDMRAYARNETSGEPDNERWESRAYGKRLSTHVRTRARYSVQPAAGQQAESDPMIIPLTRFASARAIADDE